MQILSRSQHIIEKGEQSHHLNFDKRHQMEVNEEVKKKARERERERVCELVSVCVCAFHQKDERRGKKMCVKDRGIEREREKRKVCVCVCVRERAT